MKPVVVFEEVDIYGSKVSRASGYNAKFILNNKISVGTKLKVTLANMIIPYIISVDIKSGDSEILLPDVEGLVWSGVDLVEVEDEEAQELAFITQLLLVSAPKGVSSSSISKFIEYFEINTIRQLGLVEAITDNKTFGAKTGLINEMVENLRSLNIVQIFTCANIKGLGQTIAGNISSFCNGDGTKLEECLPKISNTVIPPHVLPYFTSFKVSRILAARDLVAIWDLESNKEVVHDNLRVAFTGKLSMSRGEFIALHNITESSINNAKYLVVPDGEVNTTTSKYKQAVKSGVTIVCESDFF
jgi:NAD-dependent DNA ligase